MKRIKYITLLMLIMSFSSCNKWLDVSDSNVVTEDELFKTEKGHKQQLVGVYNVMGTPSIYGAELVMGYPDAIAQYWSNTTSDEVKNLMLGDYTDKSAIAKFDATWASMYEAIGNANILLDKLGESNTKNFEDYDLMKGEALALRAYMHFDLLRLFGPVIKNSLNDLSIPYKTQFDKNANHRLKAGEVLNLIEKDLLAAKALLQNDPIITEGRKATSSSSVFKDKSNMAKDYRSIRMNYYAVVGSLARLYQLKGDNTNAYKCAMEIIDAKIAGKPIFDVVAKADVSNSAKLDRIFSREIIFALYDKNLKTKLGALGGFNAETSSYVSSYYIVDNDMKKKVYVETSNGAAADYRMQHWWGVYISMPVFQKFFRDKDDKAEYDPIIPLMRISEMYYIAAEAKVGTDNTEALRLLNIVRKSRNISVLIETNIGSDKELAEHIFDESRKEYWGEGKLFYSYKRLFKDIKTLEASIPASNNLFILPIPKDELEYGKN